MIPAAVTPKNIKINFNFIARLSMTASGKLRAVMAIINARAVPSGMPFWNKTTATGTTATQLPYSGTPNRVAIGTENTPALPIMPCSVSWGTKL